jgi:hypothetical protein
MIVALGADNSPFSDLNILTLRTAAVWDLTELRPGLLLSDTPYSRSPMRRRLPLSRLETMNAANAHDYAVRTDYSTTPDRRYFVVRGRLWRLSNPALDAATHEQLVSELMAALRAVREADAPRERIAARGRVDAAKRGLGERGEVWWQDGAPDFNHQLAVDTPYADWFLGPD